MGARDLWRGAGVMRPEREDLSGRHECCLAQLCHFSPALLRFRRNTATRPAHQRHRWKCRPPGRSRAEIQHKPGNGYIQVSLVGKQDQGNTEVTKDSEEANPTPRLCPCRRGVPDSKMAEARTTERVGPAPSRPFWLLPGSALPRRK